MGPVTGSPICARERYDPPLARVTWTTNAPLARHADLMPAQE